MTPTEILGEVKITMQAANAQKLLLLPTASLLLIIHKYEHYVHLSS